MKKQYLLICSLSLFFVCCRKEYTCECKMIWHHYTGSSFVDIDWAGTSQSYTKKMTKSQAQSACDHEQSAVLTNFMNAFTDNGNEALPPGETFSSSCNLK